MAKIEKFVAVQMVVLGTLQLLACNFGVEIFSKANCWLRTPCGETPSVFVARAALAKMIVRNLFSFRQDMITQIIRGKKNPIDKDAEIEEDLKKTG